MKIHFYNFGKWSANRMFQKLFALVQKAKVKIYNIFNLKMKLNSKIRNKIM